MSVNVLMPQMGESITEGTVVRWFKAEGEQVKKDEPLLEISTDKVDAEVPAPASGVLSRSTTARRDGRGRNRDRRIAGDGEQVVAAAAPAQPASAPAPAPAGHPAPPRQAARRHRPRRPAGSLQRRGRRGRTRTAGGAPDRRRARRRPGRHSGQRIAGTGDQSDILDYLDRQKAAPEARPPAQPGVAPTGVRTAPAPPAPGPAPSRPFEGDELREPLSIMRQRIAEHMVASKHTSPHVYSLFEVDVSRIVALRARHKDAFERQHGLKLTVTPFFLKAVIEGLKAYPVVNASLDGNDIVFHRHVNLGVAVAVPAGLIVPVVSRAEELSVLGLQRAVTDLATRARTKKLLPDEVHGATFSVTNPGQFGGMAGFPIINQPNTAIMSIGNVQRRPWVVIDEDGREALAIRDVVYLTLSFDHRLIDGAIADQFMAHVKALLQDGSFELG
jgi:2-oxoglutarate dehydrogenase E2 component (dihydrolipoamide succinyltransferase)